MSSEIPEPWAFVGLAFPFWKAAIFKAGESVFGMEMSLLSAEGDAHTFEEYRSVLAQTRFAEATQVGDNLIIARRV